MGLARAAGIEMPVAEAVAAVLGGAPTVADAVDALMTPPAPGRNRTMAPMAHWLYKSEPSAWSWDEQVAAGEAGTPWTGVRNHSPSCTSWP